jgi:GNAT superfamily N-acetyltransferase
MSNADLIKAAKNAQLEENDLYLHINLKQQWSLDGESYQHECGENEIEHTTYTLDVEYDSESILNVGNIDAYRFDLIYRPEFDDFDSLTQQLMELHGDIDSILDECGGEEYQNMVFLDGVTVSKGYRGKGFAKQFVKAVTNIINDMTPKYTLFVLKPGALPSTQGQFPYNNGDIKAKLVKFYESCGFKLLSNGYMVNGML